MSIELNTDTNKMVLHTENENGELIQTFNSDLDAPLRTDLTKQNQSIIAKKE